MKKLKYNNGYTMIEVLIVLIILAALVAIAVPRYQAATEKMKSQEGVNILYSILGAYNRYEIDNGTPPTQLSQLDIEIPNAENFNAPSLSGAAGTVATIQHSGAPSYTLSIDTDGEISCSGST